MRIPDAHFWNPGVSPRVISGIAGTIRPMGTAGRKSKGDRQNIRVPHRTPDSRAELVARAERAQVPLSGYLADHLAVHVGREDLVRHLNNVGVRSVDRPAPNLAADPATMVTMVRVDLAVYTELQRLAVASGFKKVGPYVSAWCDNHVADCPSDVIGNRQEVLAGIA